MTNVEDVKPSIPERPPRLFGTNGIRGVVGKDIEIDFAYRVGSSLAVLFKGRRILLGRDGRTSGQMLGEATASGILAQGGDVEDYGVITTPALQYSVKASNGGAGVIITASHNPPEYNGFKIIDTDGIEIPREKEEIIEELANRNRWTLSSEPGRRVSRDRSDLYLDMLARHLDDVDQDYFRGLTVVVDTGNGVSVLTTPILLRRLGCRVITINGNIDGHFPGRLSEPRPENLTILSKTVIREKADLGIAHDGDGDRAIFVDEKGTVHWGDRSFVVVEDMVLSESPGSKVVTPVNSSLAVREVAVKHNGRLVLTKVGSIYVSRMMIRENAILGGEENGGIFYMPHHPVRDGTMAAALILKAMAKNTIGFSKLIDRLPKYSMAKEKFQAASDAQKERAMARLIQELQQETSNTLDGIKIELDSRSWALIRPSGTEPLIRIYAEAKTEEEVARIVGRFRPLILHALSG